MRQVIKGIIFLATFTLFIVMVYRLYTTIDFVSRERKATAILDKKSLREDIDETVTGTVDIVLPNEIHLKRSIEFEKNDKHNKFDTLCVMFTEKHAFAYLCSSSKISSGRIFTKSLSVILFFFLSIITFKDIKSRSE